MERTPQLNSKIINKIIGSEENFLDIISSMAEGLFIHEVNGKIIFSNAAAEKILGLTKNQLKGKYSFDSEWRSIHEDGTAFPGKDHPAMVTIRTGKPLTNILIGVYKPCGELIWISVNSIPLFDKETSTTYAVITTFQDVTNIKETQQELFESHTLGKAIVDSTSDLIWSVDPEQFGLLSFNNALRNYFLNSRNIHIQAGLTPDKLLPEEYANLWIKMYKRALINNLYTAEYVTHNQNFILELSFHVLKRDGIIFAISVFGKDITRRKQAEEKLKKESEHRQTIGELSQTFAMLISQFNNILDIAATTTARLIGDAAFIKLISDDGKSLKPAAFYHPQPKIASLLHNIFSTPFIPLGQGISGQVALEKKPQLIRVVNQKKLLESINPENRSYLNEVSIYSLIIVPLYTRGKIIGTFGLCRTNPDKPYSSEDQEYLQEIADLVAEAIHRARTHAELLASEERYRSLIENLNELVIETDINGNITYVSPNVKKLLGYEPEERLGNSIFQFVHPDDLPNVMKSAKEGWQTGKTVVICRLKHKNGEWRWLECSGSKYQSETSTPFGIIVIREITERTAPTIIIPGL